MKPNKSIFQIPETRANWMLFALLSLLVFIKCCMGHYYTQHSILVSSLWIKPLCFMAFYLPKIAIAVLIGCTAFLLKYKWWLVLVSLLIDIWFWANIIYFRVYGGYIDGYVLLMTSNLKGFESSIQALIETKDYLFFALTAVLAGVIFLLRQWQKREWKTGLIVFAGACLLWVCATNLTFYRYEKTSYRDQIHYIAPLYCFYNPLSQTTRTTIAGTAPAYDYSVLHMFFFAIDDMLEHAFLSIKKPPMQEEDIATIKSLQGEQQYIENKSRLIVILFESLEDWVVQPEFMPNTYRLINSGHSLHAHKLAKQTLAGGSADGQMIVNTGLLPIDRGAVCFDYPFNTFPSLPKKQSATLLPHPIDVWNQKCMSPAYGYDTTIVVDGEEEAFQRALGVLESGCDMLQIVTIVSHEPFNAAVLSELSLPHSMPNLMASYIKSVNVTDSYIGKMINDLEENNLLDSTTIVLTGDHTIFHKERRDDFSLYCKANGLEYGVEDAYCPLVIYSPMIKGQQDCDVEGFQMDVYPTILGVLGYNTYYWKGFGVNLADSASYNHREIDEKEAYRLSNLIIRNDYFKDLIR